MEQFRLFIKDNEPVRSSSGRDASAEAVDRPVLAFGPVRTEIEDLEIDRRGDILTEV